MRGDHQGTRGAARRGAARGPAAAGAATGGLFEDAAAASAGGAAEDLLAGLNPAQREAVIHGDGPLLILAGAGSGKTRVITRRVAWQVAERGVSPGEVLAITFTNKAAGEMRSRVAELIDARGSWIGTFHAMCARILRRDIELLDGYTRDFTIYDTNDRNGLLKELVKRAGYDTTRFRPAALGSWISAEKNRYCRDDEGGERVEAADGGLEEELFRRIRRDYEEAMRASNALDFDDLLLKVLELFEAQPGVRDAYARRFRHVLVDEYQDTNRVQYLLMRHLAGFHGNLAVCGDPDQSIYAWRGADVRNILDFEQDFPGATVVRLEQNYRSTQTILDAAQALIRNNRQRKPKELWSARGPGERLVVTECGDEDDEAREVAFQIRALVDRGVRHDQMAIFYRVNFMQRALERALRLTSIPYQIVAGTEFYQRREIRDLIAYLRLVVNPSDDEAFKRAVNVPPRGIGDKSLAQLTGWALDRRVPLLRACASSEARGAIRGRARAGLEGFAALHERLAPLADASALLALDTVLDETHYLEHLARAADPDEVDREANVEELRTHAETYDRTQPEGGLRGFLQDIALVSDVDGFDDSQPKVTLMTLHAAKGLEFPCVFIAGLEENLLPHARAIDEGWEDDGDNSGVEEERRLLYVGLTRAQERLFLSHARVRRHFGSEQYAHPSRFLDEIPPGLVEGWEDDGGEADVLGEYVPDESAGEGLAEGDLVEHDHFGRGRVELLVGTGANARATVRFEHHGSKMLLLQYARLRVVGRGGRR
jgi:DNA helicase-2/ATP-dependent DNA helicase PcrA